MARWRDAGICATIRRMPSASALRQLALRTTALLAASASVAFASGCGSSGSGSSSSGSSSDSSNQIQASTGKEIFQKAGCVSCHTLADGGGAGNISPNLDEEKPSKDVVISKVTNGDGRMPSFEGRLTTEQINTVAEYISTVAGK
jgi:cytochrome c6